MPSRLKDFCLIHDFNHILDEELLEDACNCFWHEKNFEIIIYTFISFISFRQLINKIKYKYNNFF